MLRITLVQHKYYLILLEPSTGSRGGLSLMLNVEQYQYGSAIHVSSGVHVLITDQHDSNILVENRGQYVPTGKHSVLTVVPTRVRLDF